MSGAGGRACVVGLGSEHGDDRAGWDAVALLAGRLPAGVTVVTTSDPLAVADLPPGYDLLVLVDACRGAGPPGSIHRFTWPGTWGAAFTPLSGHGLGVGEGLELAAALGRLPPRVVVLAVEGESGGPGNGLSPAVGTALPALAARVLAELVGPG